MLDASGGLPTKVLNSKPIGFELAFGSISRLALSLVIIMRLHSNEVNVLGLTVLLHWSFLEYYLYIGS